MSRVSSNIPAHDTADENEHARQAYILSQIAAAVASAVAFFSFDDDSDGRLPGAKTIKRQRRDMEQYIEHMNHRLFRRRYRMNKLAFGTLLDIIGGHLPNTGEKRKRGAVPNGPISKMARLSMALRYFSGGDPLDIADVHGVEDDEVLKSVWYVVDAIHKSPELDIKFPESYAEQTALMLAFKSKSTINIDCCIGAIDGMLVWMNKPTVKDQKAIGFGPTKFFCGRKMKFGLNMMGVCDARRRFIWVEVRFPGAASDFYAFDESHLKKKLETEGFLRPGFCLFGDNAYVNTPYMCTPWRHVRGGFKDAMNFYHSQVRINIECAFGLLVHRWGILRKPMPVNIQVHKITSLVLALCKLHNFCIDNDCTDVDCPLDEDISNIALAGGLFLPRMDRNKNAFWECDEDPTSHEDRLDELLDGGCHMDDHTRTQRRKYQFAKDMPCHRILSFCEQELLSRPDYSAERLAQSNNYYM